MLFVFIAYCFLPEVSEQATLQNSALLCQGNNVLLPMNVEYLLTFAFIYLHSILTSFSFWARQQT